MALGHRAIRPGRAQPGSCARCAWPRRTTSSPTASDDRRCTDSTGILRPATHAWPSCSFARPCCHLHGGCQRLLPPRAVLPADSPLSLFPYPHDLLSDSRFILPRQETLGALCSSQLPAVHHDVSVISVAEAFPRRECGPS